MERDMRGDIETQTANERHRQRDSLLSDPKYKKTQQK